MHSLRRLFLTVGAASIVGGAGGAVAVTQLDGSGGDRTVTVAQAPAGSGTTQTPVADGETTTLTPAQAYAASKDAVVFITAKVTETATGQFGQQQSSSGTATGTGFVVGADGTIVTNAHVIDGATEVSVKVGDGKATSAEIVGVDTSTDLAVLKVDTNGKQLKTLSLGDSDAVTVGDASYAIGNPYGLDRTLTTGVISALHRSIEAPDGYAISNVLQTDAALNPGNSGGPLLDAQGKVIGVNSQIESASSTSGTAQNSGVGFAVPSNTVRRVVQQLQTDGKATHAYLGVSTADATGAVAGAQVSGVRSGGPAADGDVQDGDVITAMDGKAITTSEGLTSVLDAHTPGDEVTLTVTRDGSTKELTVTLGTRPAQSTDASSQAGQQQVPTLP